MQRATKAVLRTFAPAVREWSTLLISCATVLAFLYGLSVLMFLLK